METQPLAAGVPYDPRRRTVFGQMDNQTAPDAPRKEKKLTGGFVKFRSLTVDREMWDLLVPHMEDATVEKVRVHHSDHKAKVCQVDSVPLRDALKKLLRQPTAAATAAPVQTMDAG